MHLLHVITVSLIGVWIQIRIIPEFSIPDGFLILSCDLLRYIIDFPK